jgi:hypothetical protein
MTKRLREGDCLAELRKDLEAQARVIKPWDGVRFSAWVQACAELLAAVPDELQRVAWAWSLTQELLRTIVGVPHDMIIGTLLVKAREIRVVRA